MNLVKTVMLYRDHQLKQNMLTEIDFWLIMYMMKIDERTQTFAFQDDSFEEKYRRPIEQFERFISIRKSAKFHDFDSYGVIQFSVILPFSSKEWKNVSDCLTGDELPPFYKNKTRN